MFCLDCEATITIQNNNFTLVKATNGLKTIVSSNQGCLTCYFDWGGHRQNIQETTPGIVKSIQMPLWPQYLRLILLIYYIALLCQKLLLESHEGSYHPDCWRMNTYIRVWRRSWRVGLAGLLPTSLILLHIHLPINQVVKVVLLPEKSLYQRWIKKL